MDEYRVVAASDLRTLRQQIEALSREGWEAVPGAVQGGVLMRRATARPQPPEFGRDVNPVAALFHRGPF